MGSKTEALEEKELGNKAYKVKDYDKAHSHYDKAILLDSGNIVFYTNKSAVFFQEERFEECLLLCKKAVDVGRDNSACPESISKPIARIARVHMKMGEYAKAVEYFQRSVDVHHIDSVHKELGKAIEMHFRFQEFGEESSVEVRDSPIHGKGVFAVRDIKKFDLLCFYDGEVKTKKEIIKEKTGNKEYWMSHPTKPNSILCGYPIPLNKHGVGQLVNDAKILDIKELDFKKGIKDCEEYTIESKRLSNVSFVGHGKPFQLFATRDIKEGEELFLHYGYKMWLQEFSEALEREQYLWKFLYFALGGEGTVTTTNGEIVQLKVEDAYDWSESVARGVIELLVRMPIDDIERCKQRIPGFTYSNLVAFLLSQIKIDHVQTSILDNDICN